MKIDLSYNELLDFFISEISKIEDLKQFCLENQLEKQYDLILKLKNRSVHKKFTMIISSTLDKLGYSVKGVHLFEIHSKLY
jgi:hypothetical protein